MNKKQISILSCLAASMLFAACSNEEAPETVSVPMPNGTSVEAIGRTHRFILKAIKLAS